MKEDVAAWERFLCVLDWILALEVRYANNLQYSLVNVSFHDKSALGNTYGAKGAVTLLVETAADMRRAFRKTDLVARNGTDIWVLLPCASHESVLLKISRLVEIAAENGLDIVDRDVSIFSVSNAALLEGRQFDSPLDFLDFLGNRKSVALRWDGASAPSFGDRLPAAPCS